jgi:hypothetical protein
MLLFIFQLKTVLDVVMAIFGFCQHQAPFFKIKCWDDDITYPSCKVATSLYFRVGDDFSDRGKVVNLLHY